MFGSAGADTIISLGHNTLCLQCRLIRWTLIDALVWPPRAAHRFPKLHPRFLQTALKENHTIFFSNTFVSFVLRSSVGTSLSLSAAKNVDFPAVFAGAKPLPSARRACLTLSMRPCRVGPGQASRGRKSPCALCQLLTRSKLPWFHRHRIDKFVSCARACENPRNLQPARAQS